MFRLAPQNHSPSKSVTTIYGPFASLAQGSQPIRELKTRFHVNANVKGVVAVGVPAALTVSLAGAKTRGKSPARSTGVQGRPVVATQSRLTGPGPL